MPVTEPSGFRVEKLRIEAVINLTNGARVVGDFFVAQASPTLFGQERVAELLTPNRDLSRSKCVSRAAPARRF